MLRRTVSIVGVLFPIAVPAWSQTAMQPTNDAPNPYQTVEGWAKMPEGRTWGSTSAVDIDRDGHSVWVAERCGANNCLGSSLDPVLKFDSTGKLVKSFGSGMILSPHALMVDPDGNIWVVDCTCTLGRNATAPEGKGHQVFKFSPDGNLLLTLGKAGGGQDPEFFTQPDDIALGPDGSIYVSEGHSDAETVQDHVLKFDQTGKFLASWGKRGTGPGEFLQPHTLAFDSQGRLFVGDRSNNRIQIFSQDGKLLDTWYQFSRPSGIYIDHGGTIYVGDSESGSVNKAHGAWKRGIRIGTLASGKVTAFIPDPTETQSGTSSAEGLTVDRSGVIYGAEVGQKDLKRYVKK